MINYEKDVARVYKFNAYNSKKKKTIIIINKQSVADKQNIKKKN